MSWKNPVTTWGQAGKKVPGIDDFNRIEGNTLDLHQFREHEQNMIVYGPGGSIPSVLPSDAPENIFFSVINHEVTVNSPPAGTVKKYKITKTAYGGFGKLTVKFNFSSTTYVLYPDDTLFVHIDNTSGTPIIRAHLSRGQESSTFTPTLRFGGSTAGITYDSRYGYYTRVGNLVTFHVYIALSSKGSAHGEANIILPFPAAGVGMRTVLVNYYNGLSVTKTPILVISSNTGTLAEIPAGFPGAPFDIINEVAFGNNTAISITGSYFCE